MQQRGMKQDELAFFERQLSYPVLDDLRHFQNVARDIPPKPVNRQMRSPQIFYSPRIHVNVGQSHQNSKVIAGVEKIDRRTTVFEMAIMVPLVFSGAFTLDKEVGSLEKEIIAEMRGHRGLQVVVEEHVPNGAHVHVSVYQRIRSSLFYPCNCCHPILLALKCFQFQNDFTYRVES